MEFSASNSGTKAMDFPSSVMSNGTSRARRPQSLPIWIRSNSYSPSPSLTTTSSSEPSMEDLDVAAIDVHCDPLFDTSIIPVRSKESNDFSYCDHATVMWLFGHLEFQLAKLGIKHGLKFFARRGFLERVARDIAVMCDQEPYGLEGCILKVTLNRGSERLNLGTIPCSSNRAPMYEIELLLTEKSKSWYHLSEIFNLFNSKMVYLSTTFRFQKAKLYRINGTVANNGSLSC